MGPSNEKGGPANRPALRLTARNEDYGFTNGGAVPTPQFVTGVLTGHTSGPKRSATGAICSPAGSGGEQPLPSHAASKSTDRRLVAPATHMGKRTQFWLTLRRPSTGGAGGGAVEKSKRSAGTTCAAAAKP